MPLGPMWETIPAELVYLITFLVRRFMWVYGLGD